GSVGKKTQMRYSLFILPRATKELSVLEATEYKKVKKAILRLAGNPRPSGCSKLTGREGWKMRVGDYRVIYEINDSNREVVVLHVGHRRDIYR
ncbi:MAG: type II toxin-antitoxin system RelE/ParE family toxin, partial [Candidatus Zixiibacteriota bacterium]